MNQTVQSVQRALKIMECFTIEEPSLSLGEISKATHLSKSTVYRLLATLSDSNYIKQDPYTQKYSLGFKLFNLGSIVVSHMNLRSVALPYMTQLSKDTSETISLNIAEGNDRVCIEFVESPQEVRNFTRVGHRNRLWVGGSGLVLLAFLEDQKKRQILDDAVKSGENDGVDLEEKLKEIRIKGYTVITNGRVKGAFAIVAPIFQYDHQLVGTITLSGPIQRFTEERVSQLTQHVIETARKISTELGDIETR